MPEHSVEKPVRIGILGAGVAGLSAAYFLQSHSNDEKKSDIKKAEFKKSAVNFDVEIYEATNKTGGLARSFRWHGIWCDIAPHRLYTQDKKLLEEMMQLVPMHQLSRKSRIYIQNRWIRDPVNPFEILLKFFPGKSLSILFSYLKAKFMPHGDQDSFEGLVLSRFGSGLNNFFFKPYSEKLFGIPANTISAEWGRRKIRVSAVKDMLKKDSKLYFSSFYYPDHGGYGAITQKLYQCVAESVQLETKVTAVEHHNEPGKTESYTCTFERMDGTSFTREFDILISTLPLKSFAQLFGINTDLSFRAAKLVYLNVNKANLTGMHWFYVADAAYKVNRVAEFKHFSHDHDAVGNSVICVEVTNTEDFSIANVISELERIGVIRAADVIDTKLIDIPCAYPIYDLKYADERVRAQTYFKQHPNIYFLGRNAQFSHVDVDEIFGAAKQMTKELVASLV